MAERRIKKDNKAFEEIKKQANELLTKYQEESKGNVVAEKLLTVEKSKKVEEAEKVFKETEPDIYIAEKCRRSFFFFLQTLWSVTNTQEPVWNFHIEDLCNRLQKVALKVIYGEKSDGDWLVNLAPLSSKSTIFVYYNAWVWSIDPKMVFICASHEMKFAGTLSTKCKDVVTSELYQGLFPNVRIRQDVDSTGNFMTTAGGRRWTCAPESSVTGLHANFLIADDIIRPGMAISDAQRESANEFISKTFMNRRLNHDTSVMFIVQQRLHNSDTTGYLESLGVKFNKYCLPAELPAEESNNVFPVELRKKYKKGLFDPIRQSREVLETYKKILGTAGFNAQFNQSPANETDSHIKRSWITIITQFEFQNIIDGKKLTYEFFGDTAYGGEKADENAFCSSVKIGQILYITNMAANRFELPELVRFCKSWIPANHSTSTSRLYIENKASGKSLVQYLKAESNINAIEYGTKGDKEDKKKAISPIVEGKNLVLVQGDWNKTLLEQLCQNKPLHDDYSDAVVMAVEKQLMSTMNTGNYDIRFLGQPKTKEGYNAHHKWS